MKRLTTLSLSALTLLLTTTASAVFVSATLTSVLTPTAHAVCELEPPTIQDGGQVRAITSWQECRVIPTYQVVSIQRIGDEWHANLSDLHTAKSFPMINRNDWVPLAYFSELTGLDYLKRVDHVFVSLDGQFVTLPCGDYTVLPTELPDMDLRECYTLNPLVAEAMVMQAINYHRFNHQLHSYQRLQSISLAAIYHSVAQRDHEQHSQQGFGGETHQERMELWTLSPNHRDYVRSSHVSRHEVSGPFTQAEANRIVDVLMTRDTASWLMNGYYHHLGVGVGIQADGTVRLTIHMATAQHPHARQYHAQNVHNHREEVYARFNAAARAWFREHRAGQTNPYR